MRGLRRWRLHNPGAPLWRVMWWDLVGRPLSFLFVWMFYRIRWWGTPNVPDEGPVLLLCNHQSYFDLLAIGIGLHHRHFHSMARASLFRHPLFAALIRSLNAFPVEQGKGDVKSVRTAIERLKQGQLVLVFPEGSRTPDGRLHAFSPGVMLLIRRARPVVVPMAVDGVYDVWRIGRPKPRTRGRIGAAYGEPIPPDDLLALPADEAMRLLERRVESLRLDVRRRLQLASEGAYPTDTAGDMAAA